MGQFRCERCEQLGDSKGGDAVEDPNDDTKMIHESCLTDEEWLKQEWQATQHKS